MYNEQFRNYTVVVVHKDGGTWKMRNRTKDEAKSAAKEWLPSWTTKAVCVFNTENHGSKWWFKKGKEIETKVFDPWATPTDTDTTTETTTEATSAE